MHSTSSLLARQYSKKLGCATKAFSPLQNYKNFSYRPLNCHTIRITSPLQLYDEITHLNVCTACCIASISFTVAANIQMILPRCRWHGPYLTKHRKHHTPRAVQAATNIPPLFVGHMNRTIISFLCLFHVLLSSPSQLRCNSHTA
jgi:hypothetical protein